MKTSNLYKVLGAIIVVAAIVGAYVFPKATVSVQGVSPVSTTNNSAKLASITMAPSVPSATTTSILNNGGTDREVTDSFAACTGLGTSQTYLTGTGLAALGVQMATSSVANGGLIGNTNLASNLTISTSSAWGFGSSTSASNDMSRVWPANSYLSLTFNATNTAACTVGVHYLSL